MMRRTERGILMDPYKKRFHKRDFDSRWRGNEMPRGLTWGTLLEGRSFFETARRFVDLDGIQNILEIGPGYGRLLNGLSEIGISPACFVGVDLSSERVEALSQKYGSHNRHFVSGDVRWVDLSGFPRFDLVISSATFEHIAPDFAGALFHLRDFLTDDSVVLFDLVDIGENESITSIDHDGTFVRLYSLDEIYRFIDAAGYCFQAVARFQMSSVELTIERDKLIRDGIRSMQDGKVALIHRVMVAATLGPRRNTVASVEELRRQMSPTLLRRILWRPLPLAVKIKIKRLIVDTLRIPIDGSGR